MNFLGGIVNFVGGSIEVSELVKMKEVICEDRVVTQWKANVYSGVGIVFGGGYGQPIEYGEEGRRAAAILDGGISNRDELCRRLTLEECPCDAGLAVAAYSLMSDSFFNAVKGSYTVAIYDEEQGRVIVAIRGRGRAPLYYIKQEECLIFASSLKGILAFGEPSEVETIVDGDGFIISHGKCERVTIE